MSNAKIICKQSHGKNHFYVDVERQRYYLFSQERRKGVEQYFRNEIDLDTAIHHGCGKQDYALHKTKDRIKANIKAIEQEYGITVLRKTRKKAVSYVHAVA